MKGLSAEAQSLLDSARHADSAPSVVRERACRNFTRALAAGTLSVSATVAKAASLGALNSAAPVVASVAVGHTLTVTLVSAVITGVSLGAIALAPASRMAPMPSVVSTLEYRSASAAKPRISAPSRVQPSDVRTPADALSPAEPSAPRAVQQPEGMAHKQGMNGPTSANSEPAPVAEPSPSSSVAAFETVENSKASIARETALLAHVHRELQQGRPASALTLLNRYQTEFPRGVLGEEAMASRIVALCQFGRGVDAARWRREFFHRYPNSPLSSRVRNACATGTEASD